MLSGKVFVLETSRLIGNGEDVHISGIRDSLDRIGVDVIDWLPEYGRLNKWSAIWTVQYGVRLVLPDHGAVFEDRAVRHGFHSSKGVTGQFFYETPPEFHTEYLPMPGVTITGVIDNAGSETVDVSDGVATDVTATVLNVTLNKAAEPGELVAVYRNIANTLHNEQCQSFTL
jgi:hypothetical protein